MVLFHQTVLRSLLFAQKLTKIVGKCYEIYTWKLTQVDNKNGNPSYMRQFKEKYDSLNEYKIQKKFMNNNNN